MKLIIFILLIVIGKSIFAQNQYIDFVNDGITNTNTDVYRYIDDYGIDGLKVKYEFTSAVVRSQYFQNTFYNYFYIKDFAQLQELGKPMLPAHTDLIFIPEGADINISISKVITTTFNNFDILPAQNEGSDLNTTINYVTHYDSATYESNTVFPEQIVQLRKIIEIRGQHFAVIEVHPMQIKPQQGKLSLHSTIEYTVSFTNTNEFITYSNYPHSFLKQIPNWVINKPKLKFSINGYISNNQPDNDILKTNYIIVCPQSLKKAADTLAKWKSQLGYKVEIIQGINLYPQAIKNEIQSIYQDSLSRLEYIVLLGDQEHIPTKSLFKNGNTIYTDNYYSCFGDTSDIFPDIALGRITANDLPSAMEAIRKIINYEKHPYSKAAFYTNVSFISSFEDNGFGYEKNNYIYTTEKIRNKLSLKGIQSSRLYSCPNNTYPQYNNNTIYSLGKPLTNDLLKPQNSWNANSNIINQNLANPNILVMYRAKSYFGGWSNPRYEDSDLRQLNNNELPIILDISGKSGDFREYNCFAESIFSKTNSGAVAVYSNIGVVKSGMNDALALSLTDAIWPNNDIISDFQTTYSGGINIQNIGINKLGDIKNQALYRVNEIWGSNDIYTEETIESLNLFGDPSMVINTSVPQNIIINSNDSIQCAIDTQLVVSCNTEGIATLIVNDSLVAKSFINQGIAILKFQPISGTEAILTVSKDGYKPFVKTISIVGNCYHAKFDFQFENSCIFDTIKVVNQSTINSGAVYNWNFGLDAVPPTSTGTGPFNIIYSSGGVKNIQLTMTDGIQNSSYSKEVIIDNLCLNHVPSLGNVINKSCSGTLTDNGKLENYTNNVMGSFTISPSDAAKVSIIFTQLDMVGNQDKINIYDGPNTMSPLIMSITGNSLPTTQIISSGSSITIEQQTDAKYTGAGFILEWSCISPSSLPIAQFNSSDTISCNSIVQFYDNSKGGVSQWHWDFGDGTSSNTQYPSHSYAANGTYTVKLKVINNYGTDSIIKPNYISVNMPSVPIISDEIRCKSGSLQFTNQNNETAYWYIKANSTLLDSGITFNTPIIDSTTYFSASTFVKSQPKSMGENNPSLMGYYKNNSNIDGLLFDVFVNINLLSIDVYAQNQNNITVYLFNSADAVINSASYNIVSGKNTLDLNWNISPGISYKLAVSKNSKLYCQHSNVNFPYTIDNTITIKENSNSINNNDYLYFYNWQIREETGCLSPKIDIAAIISDTLGAKALFSYQNNSNTLNFENESSYADSYYWDFGDGDFSLLPNPSHVYQNDGLYTISLIASNDCGQSSITKTVQITNTSIKDISAIETVNIFPNPASDILNIKVELVHSKPIEIILFNMLGEEIHKLRFKNLGQSLEEKLDISDLAAGIYYIEISTDNQRIIKKVVVE